MEKTLTRLKSNLKSRRKLSLPMLVGQFHQHWSGQNSSGDNNNPQQLPSTSNGPKGAESEEVLYEDMLSPTVIATVGGSSPEDLDCSDDESGLGDLSARSPMGKAWLSFGRSRRVKSRNKPRRWPSTPAFLPTSSRCGLATTTPTAAEAESTGGQPLMPSSSSLTSVNSHGGSSHNLTTKASTARPQPYIQGYHLTLPSFLSNRNRHLPQTTNQSQRNRSQVLNLPFHLENSFIASCVLTIYTGVYRTTRFPFHCGPFSLSQSLSLILQIDRKSKQTGIGIL